MLSRDVLKIDIPDSCYHIYARGASRHEIFLEPADYHDSSDSPFNFVDLVINEHEVS